MRTKLALAFFPLIAALAHDPARAPATPTAASPDLAQAKRALDAAKRTLAAQGRYSCCIRGGCAMCARELHCPCGGDLAKHKGVCGECLDGWRSGRGAFAGIDPAEVALADPDPDMDAMALGRAAWI